MAEKESKEKLIFDIFKNARKFRNIKTYQGAESFKPKIRVSYSSSLDSLDMTIELITGDLISMGVYLNSFDDDEVEMRLRYIIDLQNVLIRIFEDKSEE